MGAREHRKGGAGGFGRWLRDLDRSLFGVVFRWKWAPATTLLRVFTTLGTAGFVWGVTAFVAFVLIGLSPLANLLVPWAAVASSWCVAEGTKFLFDRARPFVADTAIAPVIKTPSSSSFPSGHSATAAAGALTLSVLYPPLAPLLVVAALLVILSRVYLGVHYPLDVMAGSGIGLLTAVLVLVAATALA